MLTFTTFNWENAQEVTVTAAADDTNASDDTATLTHTATGGYEAAVDLPVTVTDDDMATLNVQNSSTSEANGGVTVRVGLDIEVTGGFTVDLTTMGGTATAPDDYTALTSHTLAFAGTAGETQSTFLTVHDNAIAENHETVILTLDNLNLRGTRATVDLSSTGTVNIQDNDIADPLAFDTGTIALPETEYTYITGTAIPTLTLPPATGGIPPLAYALDGAIPAGLTYDPTARTLTGAPTADADAVTLTYTVTDGTTGTRARPTPLMRTFTVTINEALNFGAATIEDPTPYIVDQTIPTLTLPTAAGGVPPLTYTLTGTLPIGLTYTGGSDTTGGVLAGTPTAGAAATPLTYTATDAESNSAALEFMVSVSTIPSVESVTVDSSSIAASPLTTDGVVGIEITFSERMAITSTNSTRPRLALNTGNADVGMAALFDNSSVFNSNSSDSRYQRVFAFHYLVRAGDNIAKLAYTGTDALTLNGGTIRNVADTLDATLTLPVPGEANSLSVSATIVLDTADPVFALSGTTAASPAQINVILNTPANTVIHNAAATDNGALTYALGGTGATPFSLSAAGALSPTAALATTATYSIDITATDEAGNAATQYLTVVVADVPVVTFTHDAAGLIANIADGSLAFTAVWNEAVSGFAFEDISIVGGASNGVLSTVTEGLTYTFTATPTANTNDGVLTITVTAGSVNPTMTGRTGLTNLITIFRQAYDTAAPSAPTITTPVAGTDNTINAAEATADVRLTGGDVETGGSITLCLPGGSGTPCSGGTLRDVTVTGTTWAYTLTAADITAMGQGSETLTVTANDAAGNPSPATSHPITVDTTAAAPTINAVSGGFINAAERTTGVEVTGGIGSDTDTITLCLNPADAAVATCDGTGGSFTIDTATTTWSRTLTNAELTPFGEGVLTFTAIATDARGNMAVSAAEMVTVDITAPGAPVIGNGGIGDFINAAGRASSNFLGTADNDTTAVTVCIAGTDDACNGGIERVAGLTSTIWSYVLVVDDFTAMGEGPQTVRVTAFDAAGNPSTVVTRDFDIDTIMPAFSDDATAPGTAAANRLTVTVATNAPTTTTVHDADATDNGDVAETADAGLTYTLAGTDAATFMLDTDNGILTPMAALPATATTYSVEITARDAAGNEAKQYLTIAVVELPTVAITSNVGIANTANIADGVLTFTFAWSEAVTGFETNDITVEGHIDTSLGTLTEVAPGLTYTLTAKPLADTNAGTITVTVAANAATGKISGEMSVAASETQAYDTQAPTAPTIDDPIADDNTINAAEQTTGVPVSGVSGVIGSDSDTSAVTLCLAAGNTAATEATCGGTTTYTAMAANAATTWGYTFTEVELTAATTAAGEGTYTLTAISEDAAGNATASTGKTLIVDTMAPADPTITTPIADDDFINAAEQAAGFEVTVTGNSDTATVTLCLGATTVTDPDCGGGTSYPAIGASPTWSYTLTPTNLSGLVQGALTFTAIAADAAGNQAVSAGSVVTVDTVAPLFTSGDTGNSVINAAINTEVYDAEATDNGGGTETADAGLTYALSGTDEALFSIAPAIGIVTAATTLAAATTTYSVEITATDAAGNSATQDVTINVLDVPTVTITDNVDDEYANGPVTFTFRWNEGVTDFDANDVHTGGTLTGADVSAVTAINARVYTIVVTPAAGANATNDANFTLRVPANSVTGVSTMVMNDFSADASQKFDTIAPLFAAATDTAAFVAGDPTTTLVYDADATDGGTTFPADAGITYSLTAGERDNDFFTIDPASGEITYRTSPTAAATHVVEITATDKGRNTDAITVTVTVTLSSDATLSALTVTPAGGALPLTLTQADGTTTGFASGVLTYTTTAPSSATTAVTVGATAHSAARVGIDGTASDGNTGLTVATTTVSGLTVGDNIFTITVTAADDSTQAYTITLTVPVPGVPTIDTTPPVAGDDTINIDEQTAGVTLTGGNDAGITSVTLCFGGTDAACSGGISAATAATVTGTTWRYLLVTADYTAMGEGDETLTAIATDAAGNTTASASHTITVDTTAPAFTSGDTGAVAVNAALTVTAYDADAIDNGGATDAGLTYTLSDPPGGTDSGMFAIDSDNGIVTYKTVQMATATHDITITATDAAGNPTTHDVEISVSAAPTVGITDSALSEYANGAVTFTFAWSEDVTGFEAADLTYNLGHARVNTETTVLTTVDARTYTTVFTPDTVGTNATNDATVDITVAANAVTGVTTSGTNIATTASQKFDTIAPVFAAATATTTFTANAPTATEVYNAAATDHTGAADVGITYSLTGGAAANRFTIDPATGEITYRTSPTAAATHVVEITATDKGGNTATTTLTVTVTIPPDPAAIDTAQQRQTVPANWALIPDQDGTSGPDFGPGQSFRLLFTTFGTRDATSSVIADYNAFVQEDASLATGIGMPIRPYSAKFRALISTAAVDASTAAVDARDNTATYNTGIDAPIYWLGNKKVADDYTDFYDGTWDFSSGSDFRNRNGDETPGTGPLGVVVWTGTNQNGTRAVGFEAGQSRTVAGQVAGPASLDGTTLRTTPGGSETLDSSFEYYLYALSPVFTVQSIDASLRELSVTTGGSARTLSPAFAVATPAYAATAPNGTTTATVAATVTQSDATFVIDGIAANGDDLIVTGGDVSGLTTGHNTIIVTVTAEDGSTQVFYTITLTVQGPPVVLTGTLVTTSTASVEYAAAGTYTLTADPATATLTAVSADDVVTASIARAVGAGAGDWTLILTAPTTGTALADTITVTATDRAGIRTDATLSIAVTVRLRPAATFSGIDTIDTSPFEFGDVTFRTGAASGFSVSPASVPVTFSPATSPLFSSWAVQGFGSSTYSIELQPLRTDPGTATSYSETITITAVEDGRETATESLTFTVNPSPVAVTGLPTGTDLTLEYAAAASTFTLTAFPTDAEVTATSGGIVTAAVTVGAAGTHTLTITPPGTGTTYNDTVTITATEPAGVRTRFTQTLDFTVTPPATANPVGLTGTLVTTPSISLDYASAGTYTLIADPATATLTAVSTSGEVTAGIDVLDAATGTWTLILTAPPTGNAPTNTITVTATDPAGTRTEFSLLISVTLRPAAPTFDTPITGDTVTGDNTINIAEQATGVTLTGGVATGTTGVTLCFGGSDDDCTGGTSAANTVTVSGTTWSYLLVAADYTAMGEGDETLRATATDAAGNASVVATLDISVDTVAPAAPGIGVIGISDVINAAEREDPLGGIVNGTIDAGTTGVTVCIGGTDDACTGGEERDAVLTSVFWSSRLTDADLTAMGEGPQTLRVTAFDAADNPSTVATRDFTIDTLLPVFPGDDTADDNRMTVSAAINTDIATTIYDAMATDNSRTPDTGLIYTLTGTDAMTFSLVAETGMLTPAVTLDAIATYSIDITATDEAENAATQYLSIVVANLPTVDITDNIAAATASTADGDVTFTFDWSEEVTGFAFDDLTITGGIASSAGFTEVAAGLTYTQTVTPMPDTNAGTITVTVVAGAASSTATNEMNPVATATQDYDTQGPTVPTIDTPIAEDGIINAAEETSGFAVTGLISGASTVTLCAGTTTATDATCNGGTPFDATLLSTISWSYTLTTMNIMAFTEGDLVLTAIAADAAGNTAASSQTITVDTTAPAVPSITTPIAGDDIINAAEQTAGFNVAVTSSSDTNAVTLCHGATTVTDTACTGGTSYTATGASTNWSYMLTGTDLSGLTDGALTFTAIAADAAGNRTVSAGSAVTVDITAPVFTSPDTGAVAVNAETTVIAYTAVATGTLSYSLSGTNTNLFDIDATSGEVTYKTVQTAVIDHNIIITATDMAGNTATQDVVISVISAPTVEITDNVPGEYANDAVTFTLDWRQAVTGFEADDISVDGGDKGTLTETTAGRIYTLTATPTTDTNNGVLTVTVAAATVTGTGSLVGIVNVEATARQAYDTLAPVFATATGAATFTADALITTLVYDAEATDVDGGTFMATATDDGITYSLADGVTNNNLFTINSDNGRVTYSDSPAMAATHTFTVTATDKGGNTDTVTVTVTVDANDDADLRTLSVTLDDGTALPLTPGFSAATTAYTANAPAFTGTVTVVATAVDSDASVLYAIGDLANATFAAGGTFTTVMEGANTLTARVTAEDTNTMLTYTITLNVPISMPISATTPTALTFTPPDDTTEYEVYVTVPVPGKVAAGPPLIDPNPPAGVEFSLTVDIAFDTTLTTDATVCLPTTGVPDPVLYHYTANQSGSLEWLPIGTDTTARTDFVCGMTPTFSPFAVGSSTGGDTADTTRLNEQILTRASQAMTASVSARVAARVEAAAGSGSINSTDDPSALVYQFGGQSSMRDLLQAHGKAMLEDEMDYARLLDGASFVMPLSAAGDEGGKLGALSLWGGSDLTNLDGDADGLDWEGEVVSFHLGVDAPVGNNMLAGLALSLNTASFDYTDNGEGGDYEYTTTNFHPYFGYQHSEKLNLWGAAGFGQGEIEITADAAKNATDTSLVSFAGGFNTHLRYLPDLLPGGATTLNIKGDVSQATVDVNAADNIAAQKVSSNRIRLLLAGKSRRETASGSVMTPSLETGIRIDGGDGETGSGFELNAGIHYANRSGVSVQGGVHALLGHDGYNETGVDFIVRLTPQSGRGLSLSLQPVWGETQSTADRLWDDGINELSSGDTELRSRMDSEVGYGIAATMLGSVGVLTPYTGMSTVDGGVSHVRLGGRFAGGDGLNLNLEGVRENGADDASHTVLLRGELAF